MTFFSASIRNVRAVVEGWEDSSQRRGGVPYIVIFPFHAFVRVESLF